MSIGAAVTGIPPPTVTWKFNDQNLQADECLKMGINENLHEISISKCDFGHTGTYEIEAVNTVGKDQKRVTLKVLGLYAFF